MTALPSTERCPVASCQMIRSLRTGAWTEVITLETSLEPRSRAHVNWPETATNAIPKCSIVVVTPCFVFHSSMS